MKKIEAFKKELEIAKQQYADLIAERYEKFKAEDWTALTHQNRGETFYFPEEIKLFNKTERLRKKFIELLPKEFHFGRKLKESTKYQQKGRENSEQGDNGFFYCKECSGLFNHDDWAKRKGLKKKKLVNQAFERCRQHRGVKEAGKMTLKKAELCFI